MKENQHGTGEHSGGSLCSAFSFYQIPQHTQRQDGLLDQLHDLARVATRLGMYDAADFLAKFHKPNVSDELHSPERKTMKTAQDSDGAVLAPSTVRCFICNGTGFAVFPMLCGGQPCDCGEHSLRMWKHECRAVLKAKAEGKDVITSIWHPVKKWVQQEMEKADGIRETGAERVARILGIPERWL
jgi:hypothetical protein